MNKRYQDLVAAVERAINEADPIGLLAGGAPSDEYASEIGTIIPMLANTHRPDDVTGVLHGEFFQWFGETLPVLAKHTKHQRVEFGMLYWNIDGLDDSV